MALQRWMSRRCSDKSSSRYITLAYRGVSLWETLRHARAEDSRQILVAAQRPVGVEIAARDLAKVRVDVGHGGGCKRVGHRHRTDAAQAPARQTIRPSRTTASMTLNRSSSRIVIVMVSGIGMAASGLAQTGSRKHASLG
ncbi:hypothetical protein [Cupriavidus metallidurans]|uniref:hypothetical protein n=1 Tax=Cupriavidus metallidurans TaxID=119219 RepID=UPI0012DCAEFA|nr:hypothetical protein [Cupriavidus metallidurans]QGS33268.1 hypothetical protein FOB83_31465 [Cupriavidus metallidurans]